MTFFSALLSIFIYLDVAVFNEFLNAVILLIKYLDVCGFFGLNNVKFVFCGI